MAVYCSDADPDGDFDNVDTADPEHDFATYFLVPSQSWQRGRAVRLNSRRNVDIDVR